MDLAFELHDLVRTLDRSAERLLRPHGMTYRRYVAMVIVGEHPGLTGRDLARALGVSEPAASGLVRSLLAEGLMVDTAPAGSGNVRRLSLTDTGTAKIADCTAVLGSTLDRTALANGIDPTQLALTLRALHDAVRA